MKAQHGTAAGVGSHLLLELWFHPGAVERVALAQWVGLLDDLCTRLHMDVLNRAWHDFGTPGAYTLLWLLGTSHASVHTWPERNYVAFDLFTCEPGLLDEALVLELVHPLPGLEKSHARVYRRGAPPHA